mmetsp:Transcript_87243/g.270988  ORF Transcript_87243/g.270988 Transcript_87243/m.270988 type:complete len:239 (-) Transcript_87243:109-825(-)
MMTKNQSRSRAACFHPGGGRNRMHSLAPLAALDLPEHLLGELYQLLVAVLLRQVHHLGRGAQRLLELPEHEVHVGTMQQELRPALQISRVQQLECPVGGLKRLLVPGARAARLREGTQSGHLHRAVADVPRHYQGRLGFLPRLLRLSLRLGPREQAVHQEQAHGDLGGRPAAGLRKLAARSPRVLLHHGRLALLRVGPRHRGEGASPPVHLALLLEELGGLPRHSQALARRILPDVRV